MKLHFITIFLLIHIATFAQSQMANPDIFIEKLKQVSEATESIEANFTEEKEVSFLTEIQSSEGKFYYQNNGQIRWEQQSPFSYIMLVNEEQVRIQEAGEEKNYAASNRMVSKVKDLMLGLVKGDFENNKAFEPNYFETETFYLVKLLPKRKRLKRIFDKIELSFSKENMRLKKLVFYEKSGDKSTLHFYDEKFNHIISNEKFIAF